MRSPRPSRSKRPKQARRYYIGFSVKGAPIPPRYGPMHRPQAFWPKLFDTEDEAWAVIHTHHIFRNKEAIPGVRGRIFSAAVWSVPDRREAA